MINNNDQYRTLNSLMCDLFDAAKSENGDFGSPDCRVGYAKLIGFYQGLVFRLFASGDRVDVHAELASGVKFFNTKDSV